MLFVMNYSIVTCWWEENNSVLAISIDYIKKEVGPCVETVHRSLIDVSIIFLILLLPILFVIYERLLLLLLLPLRSKIR